ncbi:hypothetical protein M5D96_000082 [Drosophila gunungcola]|uniref:Uncharacterized protein n=1 Tax=Drosophila gunungcola TaxID=103775 RepID=A0A9P9YWG0_9MUSC|nr:hypothetical protein M5D96_000082 [Drosophila gunungcola]
MWNKAPQNAPSHPDFQTKRYIVSFHISSSPHLALHFVLRFSLFAFLFLMRNFNGNQHSLNMA